ncbi:MAG: hydrogenase expression/formation protein HypE [Campylobacterales bacterium]
MKKSGGSIQLSHGAGGSESNQLIKEIFFYYFGNKTLLSYEDSALLTVSGRIAMTTDGYTVKPIFFPGGDIGKIAVAGTTNDLAVMGAKPRFLSASFIIEEGLALADLERIVASMAKELTTTGAMIVTGDTKVVPRGAADGVFITTTGIGEILYEGLSASALRPGDIVLVSHTIGEHGAVIFAAREGIDLGVDLESDCASLWPLIEQLLAAKLPVVAMRDATRGGLAAVLNEWAVQSNVGIVCAEEAIPVREAVRGVCELLGFEATSLANEGTFVLALRDRVAADEALSIMKSHPLGKDAAIIAEVVEVHPGRVVLSNGWGTTRYLDAPSGELLPRIC